MLQCPQCGFFHAEVDTRCIRCGTLLRAEGGIDPLAAPGREALDLRPVRRNPLSNFLVRLTGVLGRGWFFVREWLTNEVPEGIHFRNPWIALAVGFIPGAGQLYNHQPRRAGILFTFVVFFLVLGGLTWYHPLSNWLLLAALLAWIYAAHDAFITAKVINRDVLYWTTNAAFYVAWVLLLCIFLIVGQHFFAVWLIKFRAISHDSLAPYVRSGERIALNRWTYVVGEPQIGDIVWVTNLEKDKRVMKMEMPGAVYNQTLLVIPRAYMERIVGLPGDTFERREGVFFRNGRPVPPQEQPLVTSQLLRDFHLKAPRDKYIVLMSYVGSDAAEFTGAPQDVRLNENWIPQNWAEQNYVPRGDIHAKAWFVYQPPMARRWLK